MSHAYHDGPEDAILYDNCAECDSRAANPLEGLTRLDSERFALLVERVRDVEWPPYRESYRTANEARLARGMYLILGLLERHADVLTRREIR